jgi:peptide/nickel transport system substrate-binding protein
MWGFLSEVTAVNGSAVDFVFKRAYTPGLISIGQLPIVPEHKWKGIADPATFDDAAPCVKLVQSFDGGSPRSFTRSP